MLTVAPGRGLATLVAALRDVAGIIAPLAIVFAAQPSFAQKLYPDEPPTMDPYATVYVDNGACSAGKVLKVRGAHRNQRRKKSCVPISDLQGVGLPTAAKAATR